MVRSPNCFISSQHKPPFTISQPFCSPLGKHPQETQPHDAIDAFRERKTFQRRDDRNQCPTKTQLGNEAIDQGATLRT